MENCFFRKQFVVLLFFILNCSSYPVVSSNEYAYLIEPKQENLNSCSDKKEKNVVSFLHGLYYFPRKLENLQSDKLYKVHLKEPNIYEVVTSAIFGWLFTVNYRTIEYAECTQSSSGTCPSPDETCKNIFNRDIKKHEKKLYLKIKGCASKEVWRGKIIEGDNDSSKMHVFIDVPNLDSRCISKD